jgi:hypothetical protein
LAEVLKLLSRITSRRTSLDVAAQSEGEMPGQVEIIINLISSIMFSILAGVSYRYLYLPYRRRTSVLSRLSPLDFTSDPVYLCYGLIPPDATSKNFTVAQGDLSAITLGYQVLVENYGRERVRIQNCMVAEPHLHEVLNLLSISGPRFNSITERYMKMLGSPLGISNDPKGLVLSRPEGSQEIFLNSYRKSGDPEVSYGIILGGVVMHRDDGAQKVLICAGSNSFSTYGCVVILDELRYNRSLRRTRKLAELRNQSQWGIIVMVQNLSPESAESRGQLPFERGQLKVQVVRSLVAAEFSKS